MVLTLFLPGGAYALASSLYGLSPLGSGTAPDSPGCSDGRCDFEGPEGLSLDLFTIDGEPAMDAVRKTALTQKKAPEESTVKTWIQSEEDKARALGRPMTTEEAGRLNDHYKTEWMLKELRTLEGTIRRWDGIYLCRVTQARVFAAAQADDPKGIQEGERALERIRAYARAEKNAINVMRGLASQYPAGTRFLLQLDLSKDNPRIAPYLSLKENVGPEKKLSPWEPSLEQLRQLEIVQVYERLKTSDSAERRDTATAVKKAVDEFVQDAGFYSPSWANTAEHMGFDPISLEELDQRTAHLQTVYASPEIGKFFTLLKEKSAEEIRSNEGFRTRKEFGEVVSGLQDLQIYDSALARPYNEVAEKVDAAMLTDFRKYLAERGESSLKFLKEEEGRVAAEDESQRPHLRSVRVNHESADYEDPNWVSPRVLKVREKIEALEKDLGSLRDLKVSGENLRESFRTLGDLTTRISPLEEEHAKGLLEKMIAQTEAIPSSRGKLGGLRQELGAITGDPKERLKAYRELEVKIRSAAALRLVDASIEQYETFMDEGVLTEGITTALALPVQAILREGDVELTSRKSVPSLDLNREVLDRLHTIRARLVSGDPLMEAKGLEEFNRLQNAGVHRMLATKFEGDATFNAYTIGLGIILTSGALAGAAATAVAPFVEGVAGEALILYGIEGTVFTLSHHLLEGAVYGRLDRELGKMADDPLALAGECALNAGMFAYIGKAMSVYNNSFARGLKVVAEKNVAKGLAQNVESEVARLSGELKTRMLKSAGGFAFETTAFQTWQFYVVVGQAAKHWRPGNPDPIETAKRQAFSGEAFLHGGAFLLALKAGHRLAQPIFDPVLQKAHLFAMGKRFEKGWNSLQEESAALSVDLESFYSEGKGDFGKIMERYQAALGKKWELLGTVPEEFRNEAWEEQTRENRASFQEIEGFKRLWVEMPKIMGPRNGYGVRNLSGAEGGGVFSYAPHARESFVQKLKSIENTEVKVLGETVVARFRLPGGFEVTRVFIPKPALKGLPQAAKGGAQQRSKPVVDPYEEQPFADAAE